MVQSKIFVILSVLCSSVSLVLAKQCHFKPPAEQIQKIQHNITFVNLKTIKTDGTAVAFIEDGACPVRIADKDALFEEENHHHQRYNVRLSTAAECVIHGWDNGPTTMKCTKDEAKDKTERRWVDSGYTEQPCPKGCQQECEAMDPDWNANALKMFGFEWEEKKGQNQQHKQRPTVTPKRKDATAITTVTQSSKKTASDASTLSSQDLKGTVAISGTAVSQTLRMHKYVKS